MVPARITKKGFTLIELLIVIGVVGVLATGIVLVLNPQTQFAKARDAKRKSDLENIQKALELFYNDHQKYPDNSVTFQITDPPGNTIAWGGSWGVYIQTVPADPTSATNRRYRYQRDDEFGIGQGYRLYAGLERCTAPNNCYDSQACTSGPRTGSGPNDFCDGKIGPGAAVGLGATGGCGPSITCTYGVSSSNLSP